MGRVATIAILVVLVAAGCANGTRSAGSKVTTPVGGAPGTSTSTPATTAPPSTTTAPTTTVPPSVDLRSVDWSDLTVPGSVCHLPAPVALRDGQATVAAPASLHAGTPDVVIGAALPPTFGDLLGTGIDNSAALLVSCANTGGTADGQLAFTWLVYEATPSGPRMIGALTPQEPSDILAGHVAYFDSLSGGVTIAPGAISVDELWYGPSDPTCCPSGRATTTWRYVGGTFHPSTVITRDTDPVPTFTDATSWPTLTGHSAEGELVGLDPETNQAKFVIDCGLGLPINAPIGIPGVVIVDLSGLTFDEDSDPRNPADGSVRAVSLDQWEHDAGHDGWSGYLYLNQHPPLISDGPGSFGCDNGKATNSSG